MEQQRNYRKKRISKRKLILLTSIISASTTLLIVILVIASGVLPIGFTSKGTDESDIVASEDNALSEAAYNNGYEAFRKDLMTELNGSGSAMQTLRHFFPNHLLVTTGGVYQFKEIDPSIGLNDYDNGRLVIDDNGIVNYMRGDTLASKQGIDVSSHQGKIDWKKVANDGVEFAFIRVGFRGYSNGKLNVDECFEANATGAYNAGIPFGVYVFSQAITEAEAVEEANLALEQLAGRPLELPIVYDVEKVGKSSARGDKLSAEERTKIARAFIDTIKNAGYQPAIYFNLEMGTFLIDISQFSDCQSWYAQYYNELYWPYNYKYWQYSEAGHVDGIKGVVDMNIMFD